MMEQQLPERVTLWRCAGPGCGKWSHAARRPSHHKRTIRGLDRVTRSGELVLHDPDCPMTNADPAARTGCACDMMPWADPSGANRSVPEGGFPEGRTRVGAAEQAADWELPVVEIHPPREGTVYDHGDPVNGDMGGPDHDWYEPESVTVKCGPFVRYDAVLAAQWHEDERAREHAMQLAAEAGEDRPVRTTHATELDREQADVPF